MPKTEHDYAGYEQLKGWRESDFGRVGPELAGAYNTILGAYAGAATTALDFGFGNGEMLGCLRRRPVRTLYGIEVNSVLRERAARFGVDAFESMDALLTEHRDESFDLITSMHVFEHLEFGHLEAIFEKFEVALRVGGCIIAAFPNGDSPFSATGFNSDPTHRTWLTRQKCEILARQCGLSLEAYIRFPPPGHHSQRLRTRLASHVRELLERASNKILAGIYYGRQPVELSPIACAVWRQDRERMRS